DAFGAQRLPMPCKIGTGRRAPRRVSAQQTRVSAPTVGIILTLLLMAQPAAAWGVKGHGIQVRTAVRMLPDDMPGFFRTAGDQLVILGTEPDRWRTPETPSATEITGANHNFSYELALQPMPRHRHGFVIELAKSGVLKDRNSSLKLIGLAPYAIQE